MSSSFHKSPDRRFHIVKRSQNEMNRSMALLNYHQEKMDAATARRQLLLSQSQSVLQSRNQEEMAAAQTTKQNREAQQDQANIKKLIKKYEMAEKLH